jgi:hypothetical protein
VRYVKKEVTREDKKKGGSYDDDEELLNKAMNATKD